MYDNGVGRFAVRGTYTDDNIGHHFINEYGKGSGLIPEDPELQNACRFFVAWCGGLVSSRFSDPTPHTNKQAIT